MDKEGFGFGYAEIESSMNSSGSSQDWCLEERSELEIDLIYHDEVLTDAMGMRRVSQRKGMKRGRLLLCLTQGRLRKENPCSKSVSQT